MGIDATTQRRGVSARSERRGSPTLRLIYSRGVVHDPPHVLGAPTLVVGRAVAPGDLSLASDPTVSRRHALVTLDGEVLRVTDTSSSGTDINGVRVREGVARDGDVLRMGDSFLVFRASSAAEEDEAIDGLIGLAPATQRVRSSLALIGPTAATALLLGETGTGKEVAARALHAASGRRGPFVGVNCGAITASLAESELFGHVAGAFTGARGAAEGLIRAAEGGTLLLDEIGELPPSLQSKLLRALEERVVIPVGSTQPVSFDVRVLAATNRDLLRDVRAGSFRADLYARVAEIVIELPPLRERREDILAIACSALGEGIELTPELVSALLLYDWPFNVRELIKVAAAMRIRARGKTRLDVDLLDDRFAPAEAEAPEPAPAIARTRPSRSELEQLLRDHRGLVAEVARQTGHSRRQVYRWIDKLGLDPDRFRDPE